MAKYKHLTLKELPVSERPYEKCEQYGTKALSDAELLAVILKTGVKGERSIELAERVLAFSEERTGLYGLHYHTMEELMTIRGIGRVKAIQLVCLAELTKRMAAAYNGKSNAEMLRNILAEAEKSKRAGTLSNEEIENFYQTFSPMLDGIQRKKLRSIVDKLKAIP